MDSFKNTTRPTFNIQDIQHVKSRHTHGINVKITGNGINRAHTSQEKNRLGQFIIRNKLTHACSKAGKKIT